MNSLLLAAAFLLATPAAAATGGNDFLRGSVVKSDKWKMDRVKDTEEFTGSVSFRNPLYTLKADHAVYLRARSAWDLDGSVYALRSFADASGVEMFCDRARYLENAEEAFLERGALPVRMKYRGADDRTLDGRSDRAKAENQKRLMHFSGDFALATENLDMYSDRGLYDDTQKTFLLYNSTGVPDGDPALQPGTCTRLPGTSLPAAIGKREGYDFAIAAESMKFFRDSRDIKFYNKVSGWVKDVPARDAAPAMRP
ncbi:MAG: hypothetical protein COT18_11005 [Elusimicrobia bacterium CG08_land_8_20_14_0_20_59_10]|nr:MAG: hypothetical protein COT18_11005 [Elusimicrobia bacterium CG08_land_8_20_14_0_20_59_10]